MVLMGKVYVGICEIISQTSNNDAPNSTHAGNKIRCNEVRNTPRAICGMATPTNAIGPVKAVIPPAKSPVASTIKKRVLVIEIPKPRA